MAGTNWRHSVAVGEGEDGPATGGLTVVPPGAAIGCTVASPVAGSIFAVAPSVPVSVPFPGLQPCGAEPGMPATVGSCWAWSLPAVAVGSSVCGCAPASAGPAPAGFGCTHGGFTAVIAFLAPAGPAACGGTIAAVTVLGAPPQSAINLQRDAATKMGVKSEHIYVETASGSRANRPVLAQAIAACKRGDTLACYKLDRVGRSVAHLSKLLVELDERGITFKTADNSMDTSGSTGRLVLHMLSAVAQFERDLILERTRAGLSAARSRGKRLGPPVKWQPDMARRARELMASGELSAEEVARRRSCTSLIRSCKCSIRGAAILHVLSGIIEYFRTYPSQVHHRGGPCRVRLARRDRGGAGTTPGHSPSTDRRRAISSASLS